MTSLNRRRATSSVCRHLTTSTAATTVSYSDFRQPPQTLRQPRTTSLPLLSNSECRQRPWRRRFPSHPDSITSSSLRKATPRNRDCEKCCSSRLYSSNSCSRYNNNYGIRVSLTLAVDGLLSIDEFVSTVDIFHNRFGFARTDAMG